MKQIQGGVTAAKGFFASAAEANLKYENRTDMALVFSEVPAVSAGTFTTNAVKAAPVRWDQQLIRENRTARAVVLNSGIANACTGKEGEQCNLEMAQAVADALSLSEKEVLTASTGVIGPQLPMDRVRQGVGQLKERLSSGLQAGSDAAEAIMTTDTYRKEFAVCLEIDGKTVTIGGMAKGSGMIHPNMATMLSVITTDAAVSKTLLQRAISHAVTESFNQISVDRDTSTNDTVIVLANGEAKNEQITGDGESYHAFCEALKYVCISLARKLAADGEGATKLLTVEVRHVPEKEQARALAKSVISSNLVKTAVGGDVNGDDLCAILGWCLTRSACMMRAKGALQIVRDGAATDYSEEKAAEIFSAKEITCIADLNAGTEQAVAWGCDLTYEYVKINGDYRS
ncbi:MAG: bifunctional glutamate N-acetyltransferase/amino-acid acetyltransferase ArgJ [Lachnospiraceae bacterium]